MIIYVLFKGEYSRRRTIMVHTDAKLIAKLYVEEREEYSGTDIEIWKDGKEIGYFNELVEDIGKVTKIITKKAKEIK